MAKPSAHRPHDHSHVQLQEADWSELAADTELEGELHLGFLTDTMGWISRLRGPKATPVRRVLDIGSGPGVGTCELAKLFPEADIVAIDGSRAMLDRTGKRANGFGLDARISTHLAQLPGGLDGIAPAEVIWASMSLHHIGDEIAALRELYELLTPNGFIAIAEMAEPMRVLPDELGIGRPGLADRLDAAGADWFASMRDGLDGATPSASIESMLASAGLEVVGTRFVREGLAAPLPTHARQVALAHLRRARKHLEHHLDSDDLEALDVLNNPDHPLGVMHGPDAIVVSSRQIHIARQTIERTPTEA